MPSVLGFGGKCTCCFNIPVPSLTLTVQLPWVIFSAIRENVHVSLWYENHMRQSERERNPGPKENTRGGEV